MQAMERPGQVRLNHIGPLLFTLTQQETAHGHPGIANEGLRSRSLTAEPIHHLPNRLGIPNIRSVYISAASHFFYGVQRLLRFRLLRMEVHSDIPACRRTGTTHRAPNAAGGAGNEHRQLPGWSRRCQLHCGDLFVRGHAAGDYVASPMTTQARQNRVTPRLAASVIPMVRSIKQRRILMSHIPQALSALVFTTALLAAGVFATAPLAAEESVQVLQSADYFPDQVGTRWQYRGQISEGPLQTIDNKFFSNVSEVTGTKKLNGMTVTVFHDSNPGNHGVSDSFYRRDVVGIVYYGSDPGTPLEKQIVPYQIVRFPMSVPSSFQQFDRKGLDFGSDMDRDGTDEKVDVTGSTSLVGRETITVPAGTYPDAVKVEARMTMAIHLSSGGKPVRGTDVMTAWFAKGVGLVKYFERQEISASKEDRGLVTEITEELEEYTPAPAR